MEMEEDSSSSRTVNSPANPHTPHHHHDRRKLEVYNDVLLRLRGEPEAQLPSFHDHLWAHFHRLPARYALDVNVERAEEVLTHKRLLEMAADHPNRPVFDVRVVQVHTLSDGSSSDLQMLGENHSSNSLSHMSVHPRPAFDSSPSSGALAPEAAKFQVQDGYDGENVNSLVPRAMHEITFSADDRPKLLSQLTCLLGEVGLNIQEAHVFSTNDGYSLDVFVVDGWPYEETEQLRQAIQKELLKFEKQSLSIPDQFPFMLEEAQTGDNFVLDRVEIPADETDLWEIDIRRLRFEKKVASGTYGELYKGTYCTQDVAIKVLNSERVNADMQREFAQEVYIMQKVRHRNVVQFIGACTRPPSLCIVTEFMAGGSLYDYLHKHKGSFKIPSLLRVAIDVSKGMNYLHQNNIIHRDLKAANLLMDENEVVKVADFGVARVKSKSGVMTAETGTYRWMAPEVIEHKPYDHKADVFSFAIVLWELLTGKIPHEFLTPLQAAVGVVRKGLRPAIPKNTHPKLVELLQKCWQQDPSLRPDFSEILEILQCVSKEIAHKTEEQRSERPSSSGIFSVLRRGQ